jgi:hypothetical protein
VGVVSELPNPAAATATCLTPRAYWIAASGIALIALALRLYNLGGPALWFDEAVYANNSYADFATFMGNTRNSNSSPIILPFIFHLLGDLVREAWSARLLPAAFGWGAVVLLLVSPLAGVPRFVGLAAGLWLAVSPDQITFSQEVREYSLSVFVGAALTLSWLGCIKAGDRGRWRSFLVCLGVAPLSAYGPIFLCLALIVSAGIILIVQNRFRRTWPMLIACGIVLGASMACSWILTAQYQFGIKDIAYLQTLYPPEDGDRVAWLIRRLSDFILSQTGGKAPLALFLIAVSVGAILALKRRGGDREELWFLLACAVLLAGIIAAAFLDLYPFGGIRQHIYAAPLFVLAGAWLLHGIGLMLRPHGLWLAAGILAACLAPIVRWLPMTYAEGQDVVRPVSEHLADTEDSEVFVFWGARDAVRFHFPERRFLTSAAGLGQTDESIADIAGHVGSDGLWLLLAHGVSGEQDAVLAGLEARGVHVLERHVYVGSQLVRLARAPAEDPAARTPTVK